MGKLIHVFGLLMFFLSANANNPLVESYVEQFQRIAREEMHKTGIPASIKLGQAILESNMGRSDLAELANNHFGIKCHGDWSGDSYYKSDDDFDKNGNLIESCFRKFKSPEESFIAHSEFLTAKSKAYRYGFLFDYGNDYKKWSHGLKKAGYATDPKYPQKLIQIIEKYELYKYDENVGNIRREMVKNKEGKEKVDKSYNVKLNEYKVLTEGRLIYVLAKSDDSFENIANRVGISYDDILKYNEAFDKREMTLEDGFKVFIKPKHRRYKGNFRKHVVQEGETLYTISQTYGMKENSLRIKNKIPKNAEVMVGETIYLKNTPKKDQRPKYQELSSSEEEALVWE